MLYRCDDVSIRHSIRQMIDSRYEDDDLMTTYKSMVLRALSIIDHLQANERDCKPDTVKATLHELMAPSG